MEAVYSQGPPGMLQEGGRSPGPVLVKERISTAGCLGRRPSPPHPASHQPGAPREAWLLTVPAMPPGAG